jgi:hypothetical protein
MKNYPEHKHPHGIYDTLPNPQRIWVCEECNCMFSDEEIRKDITSGKWGHICKARNYKEEHRCESHLEPFIPEPKEK